MNRGHALTFVALGIAGCAGPYDEEARYVAGWRLAEVVEVGTTATITRAVSRDCRAELPAVPDGAYAVLRYRTGNRFHRVESTSLVSNSAGVRAGDLVYINIADCSVPLVPPASTWGGGQECGRHAAHGGK